ncbi:MAG: outer membrane beta-barrel protein [Termitinemataceae bacterium]|nr:MAG: outer membrane beta-barrel protein [Termitinemataceae bacterium]
MKKLVLVLFIAATVGSSAFAQMSIGGGGFFDGLFADKKPKGGGDGTTKTSIGGGIFVFFDAKYAELDVDLLFGNSKTTKPSNDLKGNDTTHLGFSLLGKYPFQLGEKFTLFPLVGIDWQIFMGGKNKDTDVEIKREDLKDDFADSMDAFSIGVGLGGDLALGTSLYLRGEFLWNFKLLSKIEDKMKDLYDSQFTSGPRVKIGIGYKFKKKES